MIEMHVAIVCACLPMCKLPLTYVFPKVFSAVSGSSAPSDGRSNPHSDSSRGGAGSGSHSRHEWSGYTSKKEQLSKGGLHLASVSTTTRTGDDTSEEYMLETVARSHRPDDVEKGGMTPEQAARRSHIRMTRDYSVSYDDEAAGLRK